MRIGVVILLVCLSSMVTAQSTDTLLVFRMLEKDTASGRMNLRYGLLNHSGKVIIAPTFQAITRLTGNLYYAYSNRKAKLLRGDGSMAFENKFGQIGACGDGLLLVRNALDWRFGYLGTDGWMRVPFRYTIASRFNNGRAAVSEQPVESRLNFGYNTIINKRGEIMYKCEYAIYDQYTPFQYDHTVVANYHYDDQEKPVDQRRIVFGLMNQKGNITIEPTHFTQLRVLYNNLMTFVDSTGQKGLIDGKGKVIQHGEFLAGHYSDGLIVFDRKGKYGYIDTLGQVIIEPQLEDAGPFNHGLALVKKGGKWGYINKQGKWVIKPTYQYATNFRDGYATVNVGGQPREKNKDGSYRHQHRQTYGHNDLQRQLKAVDGGKWMVINTEGKVMLTFHKGEGIPWVHNRHFIEIESTELGANAIGFMNSNGTWIYKHP